MVFPKAFVKAIAAGVCDITGDGLGKLAANEKRRLLAELRKRDDCPPKWKVKDPEKQKGILQSLNNAIK